MELKMDTAATTHNGEDAYMKLYSILGELVLIEIYQHDVLVVSTGDRTLLRQVS